LNIPTAATGFRYGDVVLHDHDLPENSEWQTERRVGFAVVHESRLEAIIGQWATRPGCGVKSLERALEGRPALH
jgi:hypothetical protein